MEADTDSSSVSLDVQVVRLGWWLRGECRCSRNAKCVPVSPPRGGGSLPAYRCECNEGFAGDGFIDGVGCRKGTSLMMIFLLCFFFVPVNYAFFGFFFFKFDLTNQLFSFITLENMSHNIRCDS